MKYRSAVIILCALMFAACGSSSSSDSGTTSSDTTSITVPRDLAVVSPTAVLSAASSSISKDEGRPLGDDFDSKRTALDALIDGSGTCSLTMGSPLSVQADCYAPNLTYAGWPGASAGQASGNLPNGDLGIWSRTEDGTEACAAAKMNALVDNVTATLDYSIAMLGVMACSGRKASTALPSVGASVDMKDILSAQATLTGISVTSATLSRAADVGGFAAYVSSIEATLSIDGASRPASIRLKHIPTADDNSTYRGKLSMYIRYDAEDDAGGRNCQDNIFSGTDMGSVLATTILYQMDGSTLTYELNEANFCGVNTNPFLDENGVDDGKYNLHVANYAVDGTNEDGWGDNWNYGLFSVGVSDNGLGSVVYAWQAGKVIDTVSRIFNMTVSANADGSASGRAYAGHGNDITDTANQGVIQGFICNYTGPNSPDRVTSMLANPKVQYQALERAASATTFTTTISNIVYAPSNDCSATAGDGFTYYATASQTDTTPLIMTNDRAAATSAVSPDFVNVTSISFTPPTRPTDVD